MFVQNSRSSSSGEIFDENFHMHYLGVRLKKGKNRKRLCIQNLNTVALIDSELIRWKKNCWKERKKDK